MTLDSVVPRSRIVIPLLRLLFGATVPNSTTECDVLTAGAVVATVPRTLSCIEDAGPGRRQEPLVSPLDLTLAKPPIFVLDSLVDAVVADIMRGLAADLGRRTTLLEAAFVTTVFADSFASAWIFGLVCVLMLACLSFVKGSSSSGQQVSKNYQIAPEDTTHRTHNHRVLPR